MSYRLFERWTRWVSVLLFTAVFTGGCIIGGSPNETVSEAKITDFKLVRVKNLSYTFEVKATWPRSCGKFDSFDVDLKRSTYIIRMMAKDKPDGTCLNFEKTFTKVWTADIPNSGNYRFRFWQSGDVTLDTTITVVAN